jgi:hypothetical protein
VLRTDGVDPRRPEEQVEVAGELVLYRLDAAGAGRFKASAEAALEADIGDDLLGPAMLVEYLGSALGGEIAHLPGLFSKIDGHRRQGHGE